MCHHRQVALLLTDLVLVNRAWFFINFYLEATSRVKELAAKVALVCGEPRLANFHEPGSRVTENADKQHAERVAIVSHDRTVIARAVAPQHLEERSLLELATRCLHAP